MSFPVRHGDGKHRARHPVKHDRWRAQDFHERKARLVLLAAITNESRPMFGARNDALQSREHLAAVADTEGETVGACEEALELLPYRLVEQNRLRPTFACA